MNTINELISFGPTVIMPIIFSAIGILLGIPIKKSISGGLAIGIGFLGISIVTREISKNIAVANYMGIIENTNNQISSLDYGNSPLLTFLVFKKFFPHFKYVLAGIFVLLSAGTLLLNRRYVLKKETITYTKA